VIFIELRIIFPIKIGNNTTRNGYCKANHINEDKKFILHHASPGNEEIVLDHGGFNVLL
jgi:hypothetical protein